MITTYDMIGTPEAEATSRLSYSQVFPFMYKADLTDCPDDVRAILREVDREMAYDDDHPHAIENWRDL